MIPEAGGGEHGQGVVLLGHGIHVTQGLGFGNLQVYPPRSKGRGLGSPQLELENLL